MELNVLVRFLLFLLLAVILYYLFGKKDKLINKSKRYLYIRTALILFVVLLPAVTYFLLPQNIGVAIKFYVVFFLSVLVLVGLILFFVFEKSDKRRR